MLSRLLLLHSIAWCSVPDSIGTDIEKACQYIHPLHDVFVRKVKVLKKPKFDCKFVIYFCALLGNVDVKGCVVLRVYTLDEFFKCWFCCTLMQ